MLKNESIEFTKLIIFKILYEIYTRKETIITAIANVFFNHLNFFDEVIKAYFELRSA